MYVFFGFDVVKKASVCTVTELQLEFVAFCCCVGQHPVFEGYLCEVVVDPQFLLDMDDVKIAACNPCSVPFGGRNGGPTKTILSVFPLPFMALPSSAASPFVSRKHRPCRSMKTLAHPCRPNARARLY